MTLITKGITTFYAYFSDNPYLYIYDELNDSWDAKVTCLTSNLILWDGTICSGFIGNTKMEVLKWNKVDEFVPFIDGRNFQIYYYRDEAGLSAKDGWTVEMKFGRDYGVDLPTLTKGKFGIEVQDGTFETFLEINVDGTGIISYIFEDNPIIFKGIDFFKKDYNIIKLERKGILVKISVDNEVVFSTYSDRMHTSFKRITFGQMNKDYSGVINRVDYVKYKVGQASFDTLYFPKYYFIPKNQNNDSGIELFEDDYLKLFDFNSGWDKVYNVIEAEYGEYSNIANAETELDSHPNSEGKYGKRRLSISGGDILNNEDTDISVAASKKYYQGYKVPKRRFKILCKYLFQINLSDKIKIFSKYPSKLNGEGNGRWGDGGKWGDGGIWIENKYDYWFLAGLSCKVIGINLDPEKYLLELEMEEIL